jgi:hypothetical protein
MSRPRSERRILNLVDRRPGRRAVLRAPGLALALPWLGGVEAAFGKPRAEGPPRRFVAMTLGLGLVAGNLTPRKAGRGWEPSRYLAPLADLRDKLTILSGASHPGVTGGHRAEASILTAKNMGGSSGAKNSISLDQLMAKLQGHHTRFGSLVLASNGANSPSYTDSGAMIPAESSPARLYRRLFVEDSAEEQQRETQRLRQGRRVMDVAHGEAKRLLAELGAGDRERLDAYLTSVRDLEHRLAETEGWASRPKPRVDVPRPVDNANSNDFIGRQRLMSKMIVLALKTDSTRFITYHLGGGGGVVPIEGVHEGYHALSHHGLDPDKLAQLALVETEILKAWGDFLRELGAADEGGASLLDATAVLLTSNLGNGSSHNNKNMPVLLAGGGFRHGQHLAFDQENNYPLPRLFVSLLQRQGIETDRFAGTTGTCAGLEGAA